MVVSISVNGYLLRYRCMSSVFICLHTVIRHIYETSDLLLLVCMLNRKRNEEVL